MLPASLSLLVLYPLTLEFHVNSFPSKVLQLLWLDWNIHPRLRVSITFRSWGIDRKRLSRHYHSNAIRLFMSFLLRTILHGFFDSTERFTACREMTLVEGRVDQCAECSSSDPSQRCVHCHGKCELPGAYCVLPHVVYLAAYTLTDVKVGVCCRDRFEKRIAEQGALIAISIAQAKDGRVAGELEAKIQRTLGVPDKVRAKGRLNGFRPNQSIEGFTRLLIEVRSRVFSLPELEGIHYLDNEKALDLLAPYNDSVSDCGDFIPQLISIRDTKTIQASVITIKGFDFLLKIGSSFYVLNFKRNDGSHHIAHEVE